MENNEIISAEEHFKNYFKSVGYSNEKDLVNWGKEFAELHVKAALKEASEKANMIDETQHDNRAPDTIQDFAYVAGAKYQAEPEQFFNDERVKTLEKGVEYLLKRQQRMYSEEEVEDITNKTIDKFCSYFHEDLKKATAKEWFEQFKKKR